MKVRIKVSKGLVRPRGPKNWIKRTVLPVLAATSSKPSGISRLSQYENSQSRLKNGTISESCSVEGDTLLTSTPCLTEDFLSRIPEKNMRKPDNEAKAAITGTLPEINLSNKRRASSDVIMFLFMKDQHGEAYARFIAKAMGVEVTPELNAFDPSPFAVESSN